MTVTPHQIALFSTPCKQWLWRAVVSSWDTRPRRTRSTSSNAEAC